MRDFLGRYALQIDSLLLTYLLTYVSVQDSLSVTSPPTTMLSRGCRMSRRQTLTETKITQSRNACSEIVFSAVGKRLWYCADGLRILTTSARRWSTGWRLLGLDVRCTLVYANISQPLFICDGQMEKVSSRSSDSSCRPLRVIEYAIN